MLWVGKAIAIYAFSKITVYFRLGLTMRLEGCINRVSSWLFSFA